MESLSPLSLWIFFCLSNALENLFPPWPGDTVTVFSGFISARERSPLSLTQVLFATYLGNLLGALLMYKFGERILNFIKRGKFPFLNHLYEEENWQKTLLFFQKHEVLVILVSRFSAGIRFFVSIVAGITKMNIIKFGILYSIAISIWCGGLIFGGYTLGQNWEQILVILSVYNRIVGFFIVSLLFFILLQILKKKRRKLT